MGILGAVVLPGCGPLFGGHLFSGGRSLVGFQTVVVWGPRPSLKADRAWVRYWTGLLRLVGFGTWPVEFESAPRAAGLGS